MVISDDPRGDGASGIGEVEVAPSVVHEALDALGKEAPSSGSTEENRLAPGTDEVREDIGSVFENLFEVVGQVLQAHDLKTEAALETAHAPSSLLPYCYIKPRLPPARTCAAGLAGRSPSNRSES